MVESIEKSRKKVIFVQGPTGAGKSGWAFEQAKNNANSCIVNCDSVQIYKHVDIGSNKPSAAEMQQVPHYLYSHVDFPSTITAGQFERLFFSTIETLKEDIIFVVGGTGFYFRAIEYGMYPVTAIRADVKTECERLVAEKGFSYLFEWVTKRDPIYGTKLSINDHYRIERAYQLMRSENKSITEIQNEFEKHKRSFPYPLLKIGITEDKETLKKIIVARTQWLIQRGLVQEVESLIFRGMAAWDPLNSVGYKEVVNYLNQNKTDISGLGDEIIQNTMKLIKKQKTWFQKDKKIQWIKSTDRSNPVVDSFVSI